MNLPGIQLHLLIGPTVPLPAPALLLDSLEKVEVTHSDGERSGFELTFRAGRDAGLLDDYPLLASPQLKVGARVILTVNLGAIPKVLMDGLITHQQIQPGTAPGEGRLTVIGEDLSILLDREEKNVEHPAQNEAMIALKIIAGYARYGLIPKVIPPPSFDVPLPTERIPVQRSTDLAYLKELAARFAYVFHITPGPLPGTSQAYWGPQLRIGIPQPALSVNLGSETNVHGLQLKNDAAQAASVEGKVQDGRTGAKVPVRSLPGLRLPLALSPALGGSPVARTHLLHAGAGKNATQAMAEAQGQSEATQDVVEATGELDAARYGSVLEARGLVGLRGVGLRYDGLYYVKRVTHSLSRGDYNQSFTLVREGTGTTVPLVRP